MGLLQSSKFLIHLTLVIEVNPVLINSVLNEMHRCVYVKLVDDSNFEVLLALKTTESHHGEGGRR